MNRADQQHLGRREARAVVEALHKLAKLGRAAGYVRGQEIEALLHIVRAEHDDDQIKRAVGAQGHAQLRAPVFVKLEAVLENRGPPSAAFLYNVIVLAEQTLKNPRPAFVARPSAARRVRAVCVGISEAQNVNHLIPPFPHLPLSYYYVGYNYAVRFGKIFISEGKR